jgi:AraC-like DNA-binding protein
MTHLTFETAETMGRTAAHMGISEEQLSAMFRALGQSTTGTLARSGETARRRRLIWMAEGMGCNDATI